jgi:hypothetical protein
VEGRDERGDCFGDEVDNMLTMLFCFYSVFEG